MARRELLINAGAGQTRAALVENCVLADYHAEPAIGGEAGRVGDIWLGRIATVVPAMQAAFVDLGLKRQGFLALRDATDGLHEGQAMVVQITRAAAGAKGPKLSARVRLSPQLEAQRKLAKVPHLLQAGAGVIEQAIRAAPRDTEIVIDDARAADAARQAFPGRAITLVREDLFARHDLDEQVAALSRPRVALACGGWITIQPTEGMIAIDVNSGGFSASGGREETARTVNMQAAHQIARQVRLRGLGGLIVIDFIQMQEADTLCAALKTGLGDDSRVSAMAELGLVAIARRRVSSPLAARQACRCCGGSGQAITAADAVAQILRQVERSARAAPGREIVVRAGAQIVDWLDQHAEAVRAGLDRRGVGRVRYEVQEREDFDVATR